MKRADVVVVGGGIVGLATAWQLLRRCPNFQVLVIEKEPAVGLHQSGHNSGVLHTGIYYRPGSAKARYCTAGRREMIEFCRQHDIPYALCGKVIVATDELELPQLAELERRAAANGIECASIGVGRLKELEPHVHGIAALEVPEAGIVDYRRVVAVLADLIHALGGRIETGCRVQSITENSGGVTLQTTTGEVHGDRVVNCAGLYSDRVMRASGSPPPVRIVPFRGEYYLLREEARHLCRNLVYPVPDPSFPFLGVHFTRRIDGHIDAGPNAVLAFSREGYRFTSFRFTDTFETFAYSGFRRLAARHWKVGVGEIWRSLNKAAFVRALQRLVPDVRADDLVPAPAGVRAQAVTSEGGLMDDFLVERRGAMLHVCNAPSPAATSSLTIGDAIVTQLLDRE